jgi:hypothetical protein
MAGAPTLDLSLHVDPTSGQASVEAEIEKEVVAGVALEVDAHVDQDGKATITVGVKIPL